MVTILFLLPLPPEVSDVSFLFPQANAFTLDFDTLTKLLRRRVLKSVRLQVGRGPGEDDMAIVNVILVGVAKFRYFVVRMSKLPSLAIHTTVLPNSAHDIDLSVVLISIN